MQRNEVLVLLLPQDTAVSYQRITCLYDMDYYNFGHSGRDTRESEGLERGVQGDVPVVLVMKCELSLSHIWMLPNWPTLESLRAPNIVIMSSWP